MADKKSRSRSVTPGAKGDIAVGSAANASTLLNVGTNGQVLTADSTQALGVKWATPSSGVTTWTNRKIPTTGNYAINAIAYNGSSLYVAVGNNGTLFSSPDAITWTSRTSGFGTNHIYGVYYGNSLWVAVGANGTIATSSDAITWTTRTSGLGTGVIRDVKYANSLWVAVGVNSTGPATGITTSTDGTTWTARSVTGTIGTDAYVVNYGNGYWVVGTTSSTNNAAYSTNGTSWTAFATGSGQDTHMAWYVNGYWVLSAQLDATNSTLKYRASDPTSTWTSGAVLNISATSPYKATGIYNNYLYWLGAANITTAYSYGSPYLGSFYASWTASAGASPDAFGTSGTFPFTIGWGGIPTAFYLNSSNGQMIVADGSGRIYTSF